MFLPEFVDIVFRFPKVYFHKIHDFFFNNPGDKPLFMSTTESAVIPGVASSYTFGYRRRAEIFKTHGPPFIYSMFLKTIPIHIFPLKILTRSIIYFITLYI
jgi:hypothetical protein